MCYPAARFWIADRDVNTERLSAIESGVHMEPGNAEAWDTLGRFRQLDFNDADPAESLAAYNAPQSESPLRYPAT